MTTPEVIDLGQLAKVVPNQEIHLPQTYHAIMAAAGNADISDDEVAKKASQDCAEVPSVWFVNFPNQQSAEQRELLQKYMQSVQDYRCWASLVWWRTVFSQQKIPQDGSRESITARSAYCAKVGVMHMKKTPWLAVSSDHNIFKEINCRTTEFHTELIEAVLEGFVGITPGILQALEGILDSLRKTVSQSSRNDENKMIVCERYEYLPQVDVIRSYVRLISFSVTESLKHVQNAKKSETWIKCTIEFNDYEANFNNKLWDETSADIKEEQKKAAKDFVDDQTVDCPP